MRSRPLRTLNGRMLLWLSVMLAPLIVGGVVGLVLRLYRLHDHQLVRTIVDLGRTGGMLVIAGAIEDADQQHALAEAMRGAPALGA